MQHLGHSGSHNQAFSERAFRLINQQVEKMFVVDLLLAWRTERARICKRSSKLLDDLVDDDLHVASASHLQLCKILVHVQIA